MRKSSFRSRPSDQPWTYATSMSRASPNVELALALTCHRPVIPGNEESFHVVGLEVLDLVRDTGPRSHDRHVASQDVDQLRELVEARLPEPAPEGCDRVLRVSLYMPFPFTVAAELEIDSMYNRCASGSVSTRIVRNRRKGLHVEPQTLLRKKTGPGESSLIRSAAYAKSGAVTTSPTAAKATSNASS